MIPEWRGSRVCFVWLSDLLSDGSVWSLLYFDVFFCGGCSVRRNTGGQHHPDDGRPEARATARPLADGFCRDLPRDVSTSQSEDRATA